ncbi:uncharacterized protein L3040_002445 [Drepanopeziza brunnea f. sp. 'multigermtubi']|uniref:uncharacterized protein n=1 Tax=Drepanopeziza brunnea f. sp. 'multigermtubi' TaxID=698441 RepID=UPI00239A5314|nr:hypothetical protein L3040_002445 [Drepanopeziza brunnea f. sp. 'multigermtubi']
MAERRPSYSVACLYNLNPPHTQQHDDRTYPVSPIATLQSSVESNMHEAYSPAEKGAYYPDDKCVVVMPPPVGAGMQAIQPERRPSNAPEVAAAAPAQPPGYAESALPERPEQLPFWRRNLLWIIAIAGLIVLVLGMAIGMVSRQVNSPKELDESKSVVAQPVTISNNTLNSVASSSVILNDNKTINTHVVWQNSTNGTIHLQVSLDGKKFQAEQLVKLEILPRLGSPLSATTEVDPTTGVVMLNVFYLSGYNNITMSAVTCSPYTDRCNTIANCVLPTKIPASNYTGLAAVNVNSAQDWRVYYHDKDGYISELQGDNSGFNTGKTIGGSALNGSSIAAVNINSTTNNINVFFVDTFTKSLFKMQYTANSWTKPSIVSSVYIDSWNPLSGLAAAYTVIQDQLHVYYTGLDKGIYEFIGSRASTTVNTAWDALPTRNSTWGEADIVGAPISAVGWDDQARFYQIMRGTLAENSLDNTTWTESFIDDSGRTSK